MYERMPMDEITAVDESRTDEVIENLPLSDVDVLTVIVVDVNNSVLLASDVTLRTTRGDSGTERVSRLACITVLAEREKTVTVVLEDIERQETDGCRLTYTYMEPPKMWEPMIETK